METETYQEKLQRPPPPTLPPMVSEQAEPPKPLSQRQRAMQRKQKERARSAARSAAMKVVRKERAALKQAAREQDAGAAQAAREHAARQQAARVARYAVLKAARQENSARRKAEQHAREQAALMDVPLETDSPEQAALKNVEIHRIKQLLKIRARRAAMQEASAALIAMQGAAGAAV